jgi:hypothetical protein
MAGGRTHAEAVRRPAGRHVELLEFQLAEEARNPETHGLLVRPLEHVMFQASGTANADR